MKKYQKYAIRVTNHEGSNIVKLNKNVDMTCYSVAKRTYHLTKEIYENKNEDVTVELIGLTEEDAYGGTLYSKEFKRTVNQDGQALLKSTADIISEIKYLLRILEDKRQHHESMLSMFDKKRSILLHKIESLQGFKGEKADLQMERFHLFNLLENLCHDRRKNKNENKQINIIYNKINIPDIIKELNRLEISTNPKKAYIDTKLEQKIMREYPYNTEKEQNELLKQLKNKYANVVVDKIHSKIIAYNNGIYDIKTR